MKLIVGLGNPGRKYQHTRHNTGFMIIDMLSEKLNQPIETKKFQGLYTKFKYHGEDIVLLKPETYMNESGVCVQAMMNYFKIDPDDLLVIYDDLDMEVGKIRLRSKGSAGGHNGIKSIIKHIGSQEFKRIKIGIGRPKEGMTVVHHVLGKFDKDAYITILNTLDKVDNAVNYYLQSGNFEQTMQKYNG